jgi:hypothetical protein
LCAPDDTLQLRAGRDAVEEMSGSDDLDSALPGVRDGGRELFEGPQLEIDPRGKGQKLREEFATPPLAQALRAAFGGMAHGDNERHAQTGQGAEHGRGFGRECIDTDFEEIDLARAHLQRASKRSGRVNGADDFGFGT